MNIYFIAQTFRNFDRLAPNAILTDRPFQLTYKKWYVSNSGWQYNKTGRWTDKLAKAKLFKSLGVARAALTNLIKLNPGESYDIIAYELTTPVIMHGEQAAAQERLAERGREKLIRQRSAKAVELAEKKRQLEKLQAEIDNLAKRS